MDVWIVEAGMDYEAGAVMGVRSTEEKAERLRARIAEKSTYDWTWVSRHKVDEDESEQRFADYT